MTSERCAARRWCNVLSLDTAIEFFKTLCEISSCDRVIEKYRAMGISWNVHDIEHRTMRADAVIRLDALKRRLDGELKGII